MTTTREPLDKTPAKDRPYCCGSVDHGRFGGGFFPCANRAKVLVDGKPYCGVHDPDKVAARRDAREAKYRAKRDASEAASTAAEALAARLAAHLGVAVGISGGIYDGAWKPTRLTIGLSAARDLLDRLDAQGGSDA